MYIFDILPEHLALIVVPQFPGLVGFPLGWGYPPALPLAIFPLLVDVILAEPVSEQEFPIFVF